MTKIGLVCGDGEDAASTLDPAGNSSGEPAGQAGERDWTGLGARQGWAHGNAFKSQGKRTCRAATVSFFSRHGITMTVSALHQVVLSAGAVHTPKLLMLSGIGDADHLAVHNLSTKVHLPGVGRNLQDHTFFPLPFRTNHAVTYRRRDATTIGALCEWLFQRTGVLTSALLEATAFVRTRRGLAVPDMQLHVVVSPGSEKDLRNFGVSDEGLRYFEADPDGHGFVILPTLLHPAVAGSISLADGGTFTKPLIEPKYLQHQDDIASYLAGIKLALRLAKAPALSQWTDGRLRAWRLAVTGLRR